MTDTPYTGFAYANKGGALRTSPQRQNDWCNVMDFGAKGDNIQDDAPYIQLACNAAASDAGGAAGTKGIVFFPAGAYKIGSRITVNDQKGIWLMGMGCNQGTSSQLLANMQDYIIVCAGNSPRLIQGLSFQNNYVGSGPPTTMEPPLPLIPGYPAGANGDGRGCIYMANSSLQGYSIRECDFGIRTGVALVVNGPFQGSIINCNFSGSYDGASGSFSGFSRAIGIATRSSYIRGGKWTHVNTGIECYRGPSIIEFVDIEKAARSIYLGSQSLKYWDGNDNAYWNANANNPCGGGLILRMISQESCSPEFITGTMSGRMEQVNCAGFGQDFGIGTHGFKLACYGATFLNCSTNGGYTNAAFEMTGEGYGNEFFGCQFANSGAGSSLLGFKGPTGAYNSPCMFGNTTSDPVTGMYDNAILVANLPSGSRNWVGARMVVSNSVDKAWETTTDGTHPAAYSNIGKPVVGGGSNKVSVTWNGTTWVIAG